MSALQLRRIAMVLGVLVILWVAAQLLGHKSDQVRGSLVLPHVAPETSDTITIGHGADTVRLVQRAANQWTANGYPATPGAPAQLIAALDDTSPRELASVSASSLERMGVDSGAWVVSVGPRAHPTFTLLIGSAGPEYGTGYVRLAHSDTVYLWRGALSSLVRRPAEVWRDHHIGGAIPDSVQRIDVTGVGKAYSLRRDKQKWLLGTVPADSAKVATFLSQIRSVEAEGFATAAQLDSIARAKKSARRTLTVRGAGATPLLALTFDSLLGSFWVTKPGDPTVYRLDNWQGAQLLPTAQSLTAHH